VLRGRVTARSDARPLSGAAVAVSRAGSRLCEVQTDAEGRFECRGLPPGTLDLAVRCEGFHALEGSVEVASGSAAELSLELDLQGPAERVEVSPPHEPRPAPGVQETLDGDFLQHLPEGADDVLAALTVLPGVLRVGDQLSLRGGRPDQAATQIDTMLVNDPATGEVLLGVPVDGVAWVDVFSNPADAELGRFASGVVVVHTRGGSDRWRFALNNLDPVPWTRRGRPLEVTGIRSFAPRLAVSGPLVPGRVFVSESLQYRHTLSDVTGRPESETMLQEYVSSLTRIDARVGERHLLTAVLDLFPERKTGNGLSTLTPLASTFDETIGSSHVSVSDTATLSPSAVVTSGLHLSRSDLTLGGHGAGEYAVAPQGDVGRYYNDQQRRTDAWQWQETASLARNGAWGDHLFKLGLDALHSDFAGSSQSAPVEALRLDGTLAERIVFGGPVQEHVEGTDVALFAGDRWRPLSRLLVEYGGRLDHDAVVSRTGVSPRLGAVLDLDAQHRLALRASVGRFDERTPAIVGAFDSLETQTVTRYAADGVTPLGPPTTFEHRTAPGLAMPQSLAWNVGLDGQVARGLALRAGYLSRLGSHEPIVEPVYGAAGSSLLLTSLGQSAYRELELTLRYAPRPGAEASFSYVHSRSTADLAAYTALFGSVRDPFVRPNEYGPTSADVPDRLIARGTTRWARHWRATAVLDWRKGFPYSAVDEYQDFVGPENGAGRFPATALLDFVVERQVHARKLRPWIGLSVRNAFNVFAAHTVQDNVTASDFGTFYDRTPRRVGLTLRLER